MARKRWSLISLAVIAVAVGIQSAQAGDLKINIPLPSKLTPVQRLNREGVEAVKKHNYAKAERLFYKAYLFDPEDAFTLNNLGYISELQGQIDRAERFYYLAAQQSSGAVVDLASAQQIRGRPMKDVLAATNAPLEVNHANVEAVRLLSQGRAPEADLLLEAALKNDPQNIFTLNNLGVAKEMEGEEQQALRYFDQASRGSREATAVVTTNSVWRGKQVTEMAQRNARNLRDYLGHEKDRQEQIAELNLRGVSAVNRNDLRTANEDFRQAYALDQNNAFTLNNIGYVAELEGDQETAGFFYDRARQAAGAQATVAVATRRTAEGQKLFAVAGDNTTRISTKVAEERQSLQRRNEPVALRRRDNSIVDEAIQPAPPAIQGQPQR